jgi:hypothetical protein
LFLTVDLHSLLGLYESSEATRNAVAHNIEILRCVRGGLRMAEQHRLDFEPRVTTGDDPNGDSQSRTWPKNGPAGLHRHRLYDTSASLFSGTLTACVMMAF